MQKINLKVAYCTQCDGYRTSIVTSKINNKHDDVIDHYLYHGSPWFTFDYQVFSEISSKKDVEIREVGLSQHRKNDRKYCTCDQVSTHEVITAITPKVVAKKHRISTDFSDADYYFRDVYHLASMFH